jgi:hypothetical protein
MPIEWSFIHHPALGGLTHNEIGLREELLKNAGPNVLGDLVLLHSKPKGRFGVGCRGPNQATRNIVSLTKQKSEKDSPFPPS